MPLPDPDTLCLTPESAAWIAELRRGQLLATATLQLGGHTLWRAADTEFNGLPLASAVVETWRCRREGATAIVESDGFFPFGAEIRLQQRSVYAGQMLRQRLDVTWPAATPLRQPTGFGNLDLPGPWARLLLLDANPDAAPPAWQPLPDPATLPPGTPLVERAQPPLAILLERPDGSRLEIGTGSDLWRWLHAFGTSPATYRLETAGGDALRFRRTLATPPPAAAEPTFPQPRKYRFTCHCAWETAPPPPPPASTPLPPNPAGDPDAAALAKAPANAVFHYDFASRDWPGHWRKSGSHLPCWEEPGVQRHARTFIRRLAAARPAGGTLILGGLLPGRCLDAGHLEKNRQLTLPHWDSNGLHDFATWAAHQLGAAWTIHPAPAPFPWCELPSLRHLFALGGFATPGTA
ncbi:MAG: hypothetical protein WC789_08940 [Lentisphaeria bacterium]